MKLIFFGALLLFTHVLGETNYILDEISEKYERKLHEVNNVRQLAESVEALKTNDETKDFLVSSNVQNEIQKLLNFFSLISVFINSRTNVANSSCLNDLSYIKENIDFKDLQNSWALKMLDSFGKPESGILEGNIKWLGDFDECRSVYAPKNESSSDIGGFHGQYCTLGVKVAKILPLFIGVCLPDTCNPSDLKEMITNANLILALNPSGIEFNVTSLTCKAKSLEISNGGIATLCIMSVFFVLVFLGSSITALKYFTDPNTNINAFKSLETPNGSASESIAKSGFEEQHEITEGSSTKLRVFIDKCDPFLNCFCIFTNGSKLLNTDSTEGQLLCLHGIRFLSMTWVILGHTYSLTKAFASSLKSALPLIDNLPFQVVLNGWYAVDSFFVLSGFLLSYLYFQECAKRQGKTPWLYFYVHRYLRLTPVYMIVLAFFATLMQLMGSGPFWTDTNADVGCQNGWWWNLLYINNIQQDPLDNNQCMGWSWYLANDMQFFVISPLFLITLRRWPKVGFLILFFFLSGSWITIFLITYQNDLRAGTISDVWTVVNDPNFDTRWNEYMEKIYIKPYGRVAPYIIGIGLGYILFKRKIEGLKSKRTSLLIGWLLAVPSGLYCIYGVYHQNPNLVAYSFYNALSRTVYGLSIGWLIFVCLSEEGGIVDKILSYKFFIPLSRLTYCAYLIHPIFLTIYFTSLKTTFAFSHQTVILLYLGLLIIIYAFAFLLTLVFESPLIRLEKFVRNKF